MFAKGREEGRVVTKNPVKRTAYISSTRFKPTPRELTSFQKLQKVICKKLILYHLDPDRQLFLQIDGSIERGFGVIVYHLKRDFQWQPTKNIPATAIEPVIFFSRCLTKEELHYRSSELEIVYLVWTCKRLRT